MTSSHRDPETVRTTIQQGQSIEAALEIELNQYPSPLLSAALREIRELRAAVTLLAELMTAASDWNHQKTVFQQAQLYHGITPDQIPADQIRSYQQQHQRAEARLIQIIEHVDANNLQIYRCL